MIQYFTDLYIILLKLMCKAPRMMLLLNCVSHPHLYCKGWNGSGYSLWAALEVCPLHGCMQVTSLSHHWISAL